MRSSVIFGSLPFFPKTRAQRRYKAVLPQRLAGRSLPTVSLVIPTRNRPEQLAKAIVSIKQQTIKPLEVIIVDDGNLRTGELETALKGSGIQLKHVRKAFPGISRSRNAGVRHATGDIVFFVDDDIILIPSYIEEMLKVFVADEEKKVGGVDGHLIREKPFGLKDKLFRRMFYLQGWEAQGMISATGFGNKVLEAAHPVEVEIFGGVNAFRKEVFESLVFDEHNYPGYTLGEDNEFSCRVSRHYKLVHTPFARFWHFPAETGRPCAFRRGVQSAYSAYKARNLNYEWGVVNNVLSAWRLFGKQTVMIYHVMTKKGRRKEFFVTLLGQQVGFLTLPLSIATHNRLAYEWNQWLSKVEE